MDYNGKMQKLSSGDYVEVAQQFGLHEAHLRTVTEVETSGSGYDSTGHVTRLFEPHIFYAELKGDKTQLNQAIKQGLAYPHWKGPGSYPKTPALRWQQFQRACVINETAAIRSASWGLGQIMGREFAEAGYDSPEAMVTAFGESERQQLVGMCNLIKARRLDVQLKLFPAMTACRAFAKGYNGSAYEKNNYHVKLHDAYIRWHAKEKSAPLAPDLPDDVLQMGSTGDDVKAMQDKLNELGYINKPDGKFGTTTRGLVLAWKADNNRPLTPYMDSEDIEDLEGSPEKPIPAERTEATLADIKPSSSIVRTGDSTNKIVGGVAVAGAVSKGADQFGLLDHFSDVGDKADSAKHAIDSTSGVVGSVKEAFHISGVGQIMLFINDHLLIIMGAALIAAFVGVRYMMKARLRMTQKGEAV